jgi:hypothetical protein
MFAELIPLMINVIRYCLANGFEDEAIGAFEVFDDLIEMVCGGFAKLMLASHCQSLPILCRYCSALFWKLDQITPCR